MSPVRPTVETILANAVEIASPEARQAFVTERCAGDDALRHEVERLVACHFAAGRFLEPNAAAVPTVLSSDLREKPGAQIGPYKLLEQIGEGGFGVVFMAEQSQPIRRRVALKILKPGMDTRQVIARFEAERQALALMDHPHIAKVLDAGATETGRPFFVMELVKGMAITRYCDEERLPMRERLQLFVDVCGAIQHAHQKGIIHRDIKPNNVLVTLQDGRSLVKVIDFGVAKALGQQLTEKTVFTGFAQMVGTPLYMSPEQAALSNVDVDTRSDVYSLGVLLYELLTSSTPFTKETLSNASYDELRRIIREDEPPRPSTRVSTMQAGAQSTKASHLPVERQKLSHQLRGELDWIVMKALEKDRNRRYESASALAVDVERHLNGETVLACPPSAGYRFHKFARKHRVTLTTCCLVGLSLVVGTTVSVWQAAEAHQARQLSDQRAKDEKQARDKAEEERKRAQISYEKAREAVHQMLTRVADEQVGAIPEMKEVRRKLLEDAALFYTELLKLNPRDAAAYHQRGNVHLSLGRYDQAVADATRATELEPNFWWYHHELASCLRSRHDQINQDPQRALVHALRATELAPNEPWPNWAVSYLLASMGRNDEARQALEKFVQRMSDDDAYAHTELSALYGLLGDEVNALKHIRRAIELDPFRSQSHGNLSRILLRKEKTDEALKEINEAIRLNGNPNHPNFAHILSCRAEVYEKQGQFAASLLDWDQAIARSPQLSSLYKRRALAHFTLGNYESALADIAKGIELNPDDSSTLTWISPARVAQCPSDAFREGLLQIMDQAVERTKATPNYPNVLASRGELFVALKKFGAARVDFDLALKHPKASHSIHYRSALAALVMNDESDYRRRCAAMVERYRDSRDPDVLSSVAWTCALAPGAVESYETPLMLAKRAVELRPQNDATQRSLGAASYRVGRYVEAQAQLSEAELAPVTPATSPAYLSYFQAMAYHQLNQADEAKRWLERATQESRKELDNAAMPPPWQRQLTLQRLGTEASQLIKP